MKAQVTRETRASRVGLVFVALVVAVLAAAPLWAGADILRLLVEFFVYASLTSLWNLLAGYAGLVSVGQQAFVGLGGYTLFAVAILGGANPLFAVPLAGLIAGIVAVPLAALLFRLRNAYFAIGSWVVAEVFRLLASQIGVLGGGSGISLPARLVVAMAPTRQAREITVYYVAFAVAVVVLAAVALLLRSRFGLALTALRDNEVAARSSGVSVREIKYLVYVVTAACTGMGGALIFLQRLRISPDAAFSVNDWTALVIFMTVIGGIGSIEGPLIGTILFFLLRGALADLGSLYLMTLGALAIAVMLISPRGLWGAVGGRLGWQLLPLQRRLLMDDPKDPPSRSP